MNWEIIDYKHKKTISNLPIQCKKKYAVFKYIAQKNGINGVRSSPGFHLEILKGKLSGFYSIRLNLAYRVIFELKDKIRVIEILEVSKHEYRQ